MAVRAPRTRDVFRSLLLAALLACPLASAGAQEAARAGPDEAAAAERVAITTVGTYAYYRPVAHLRLSEPSFVAVFEIEPGVGATMLYPHDPWPQEPHGAGVHRIDLTGPQARAARSLTRNHLGWAFVHRPAVVPRNHLVAVASDRPLQLDALLSGRVFEFRRGYAGAGEVERALLAHVLGERGAVGGSSDRTSYWKFRDPTLLAQGAGVPWLTGSLQFLSSGPTAGLAGFGPFTSFGCPWRWAHLASPSWPTSCAELRPREGDLVATRGEKLTGPDARDPTTETDDETRARSPEAILELLREIADATTRLDGDDPRTARLLEGLGVDVRDGRGAGGVPRDRFPRGSPSGGSASFGLGGGDWIGAGGARMVPARGADDRAAPRPRAETPDLGDRSPAPELPEGEDDGGG